jgi:hypothetical protein
MNKFTEMTDINGREILSEQNVRLFGLNGRVVYECGLMVLDLIMK